MLKRLICLLVFHRLVIVHECSRHSRKLQCVRCKRFFGMNDDARVFIEWSIDLRLDGCEHI